MYQRKTVAIPYNPKLRALARELRKNGTLGEVALWRELKGKKLGLEFHRQVPIDEHIVDFFCHEIMLAIEVDGSSHAHPESGNRDVERQRKLETLGVHFLRFTESEVRQNAALVAEMIKGWIDDERVKVKDP